MRFEDSVQASGASTPMPPGDLQPDRTPKQRRLVDLAPLCTSRPFARPRIGDMYGGIVATALALWAPPLFGGLMVIVLIAVLARVKLAGRDANFRDYDARAPMP